MNDLENTNSESVNKEEIKDKLFNLEKQIDNYDGYLNELGMFIYNRMNSIINPMGFLIIFHTSIIDLKRGINSRTECKIISTLTGMNTSFYNTMIYLIPNIAEVVFEEDFSNQVKKHHHEIMAEMQKIDL